MSARECALRLGGRVRAGLVALVAFILFAGTVGANGLIDGSSYESPTYGYHVRWDQPWEPDPDATSSERGFDALLLAVPNGTLTIVGVTSDATAEEIVAFQLGNAATHAFDDLRIVEQGADDEVAYALVEGAIDGAAFGVYYEVRELAPTPTRETPLLRMWVLFSPQAPIAGSAAAAVAGVEVDGEPVFVALDAGGFVGVDLDGYMDALDDSDPRDERGFSRNEANHDR
jgi:hypothetical protein